MYRDKHSNNIPYPWGFYLTDGINIELWCSGYIIVERNGKTHKMIQIQEEYGSTGMKWYDTSEVKGKYHF